MKYTSRENLYAYGRLASITAVTSEDLVDVIMVALHTAVTANSDYNNSTSPVYSPVQTLMSVHLVTMHACSTARTHQGDTIATAILDTSYKTMAMTVKVSLCVQQCFSLTLP